MQFEERKLEAVQITSSQATFTEPQMSKCGQSQVERISDGPRSLHMSTKQLHQSMGSWI